MRIRRSSALLAAAIVAACSPLLVAGEHPAWVHALIRDIQAEPVRSPPAHLATYAYRGGTVYFVPQHCCDIPSVLYDAAGTVICNPDGGLTGGGDGRCADFFEERRQERIIWRDRRG